jgi:hypothetical protein
MNDMLLKVILVLIAGFLVLLSRTTFEIAIGPERKAPKALMLATTGCAWLLAASILWTTAYQVGWR